MTISLSDPIDPATFAEILVALETLHRDLTGRPLQALAAKIGDTEAAR